MGSVAAGHRVNFPSLQLIAESSRKIGDKATRTPGYVKASSKATYLNYVLALLFRCICTQVVLVRAFSDSECKKKNDGQNMRHFTYYYFRD